MPLVHRPQRHPRAHSPPGAECEYFPIQRPKMELEVNRTRKCTELLAHRGVVYLKVSRQEGKQYFLTQDVPGDQESCVGRNQWCERVSVCPTGRQWLSRRWHARLPAHRPYRGSLQLKCQPVDHARLLCDLSSAALQRRAVCCRSREPRSLLNGVVCT